MRPYLAIQPRSAVIIAAFVAFTVITFAVFELWQSKKDLYLLMEENGISLLRTINHASTNAILSSDEIEELVIERLRTTAHFVATIDSLTTINAHDLKGIAEKHNIFRIHLFNGSGKRILSSEHSPYHQPKNFDSVIAPLLDHSVSEVVVGFHAARFEKGSRFGIGIPRASTRRGAIVLNIDATYLTDFRSRIGIGKMIQEIGSSDNIEYVVLQDDDGIVAASKGVHEMTSIAQDEDLRDAFSHDSLIVRETLFNGHTVLECLQPLTIQGDKIGVFRVGVSMVALRALEDQMIWRAVIILLILLVLSAIVIGIIVAQQQATAATQQFENMQSYSGMILDNMADAVITTDRDGRITIFNQSALRLCSLTTSPEGIHISQLLRGQLTFALDSLNNREQIRNKEITLRCGETVHTVIVNTTLTIGATNTIESYTIVLHNITELRRLEQHIRQKEKMVAMGELAGGVAHEIRNPLNAMYMIAQRFEKEFSPKTKVREYRSLTGVLKHEAQRVNGIIHQFLRFARPPQLHLESVPLNDLLDEIRTMYDAEMGARKIRWYVDTVHNVVVPMDRQQFMQAMINVILNAVQAVDHDGNIEVRCNTFRDTVLITIADTGPGIPREELGKIFNLYYTTKPTGTGMGLSIVQQIIAQHNGTLSVDSTIGTGTTFTIELPFQGTPI